jgi:hypothetical protein
MARSTGSCLTVLSECQVPSVSLAQLVHRVSSALLLTMRTRCLTGRWMMTTMRMALPPPLRLRFLLRLPSHPPFAPERLPHWLRPMPRPRPNS